MGKATDSSDAVTLTVENGLARMTLNRPDKLNALNVEMFRLMNRHLDSLEGQDIGALIFSGAGRSFCAGHDLDDLAAGDEAGEAEKIENHFVERLAHCPFPVIGKVRGHCYTGGLELILASDIIYAADDARFADTHAKFDLVPIWGLTQRLPRRIGMAKAKEMMFSARTYSGEEASAIGLVNHAVPDAELDEEVESLAADILKNSRRSNREVKKLLISTDGMSESTGNAWELAHHPGHGPAFDEVIRTQRSKMKGDG